MVVGISYIDLHNRTKVSMLIRKQFDRKQSYCRQSWGCSVAWAEGFDRDMTGRRRLGRLDNEASIRGRTPPLRRWQLLRYCHVRSNWSTGRKHVNRNHSRHCPLNVGTVFEIELHNECFRIRYHFVRIILTGWLKEVEWNTRGTRSR